MSPEQRDRQLALAGVRRFDPTQPRDPHTGEWIDVPGVGEIVHQIGDVLSADEFGNHREGGRWFDADDIYMTDSYVEQYGLPVTHSSFGDRSSGRYTVVLSERGDMHVMWEDDGGPADALYSRDDGNVRMKGLDAAGARSLADDITATSESTAEGGEDSPVGRSRTNAATDTTLTSAPYGGVVVSGLGKNGKDVKLDDFDAGNFAGSLESIADSAEEHGSRG